VTSRPDGVRVTDRDRTVLDGIADYEKVMGMEELLRCIALIPTLGEKTLLDYLAIYNKQVLYQKAGYILDRFQRELGLSAAFFDECVAHIGKSTRYLSATQHGVYDSHWCLVVPENFSNIMKKGVDEDADF
jgi:predicted transcriptional regulator of viral defense system